MGYSTEVLADSPALYWKLDDASGAPQDSSGNGRHAASATGIAYQQTGVGSPLDGTDDDYCISCNSGGDVVRRTTMTGIDATDNFTVECWVKVDADTDQLIWMNGQGVYGSSGYYLFYEASSNKLCAVRANTGAQVCRTDAGISTSTWYHVVVKRVSGTWKMFLDGVEQTGLQGTSAPSAPATELALFKDNGGAIYQASDVDIAHFAIYQTALSDARIVNHAAGGPSPPVMEADGALSPGVVGASYSDATTASGGYGTLEYTISSGSLPNGLSINAATGAITGTPTLAGVFSFDVTATDDLSATDTGSYSITVTRAGGMGGLMAAMTC